MKTKTSIVVSEILAFLVFFFQDMVSSLVAIGFLVLADSFTGIWAAWKNGGWYAVTSRKMGRIVAKLILYPLAIIVAKVAQTYLSPIIPWVDVTMGILAVIEVKSIFENIGIILGFDLWRRIKERMWPEKLDDK